MKLEKLRIELCHATCPKCKLPTAEFKMFESNGPAGEFITYIGKTTGSIYRVHYDKIRYMNQRLDKLLEPAIKNEGGKEKVIEASAEVKCKMCGLIFSASEIATDGEEIIEAYDL